MQTDSWHEAGGHRGGMVPREAAPACSNPYISGREPYALGRVPSVSSPVSRPASADGQCSRPRAAPSAAPGSGFLQAGTGQHQESHLPPLRNASARVQTQTACVPADDVKEWLEEALGDMIWQSAEAHQVQDCAKQIRQAVADILQRPELQAGRWQSDLMHFKRVRSFGFGLMMSSQTPRPGLLLDDRIQTDGRDVWKITLCMVAGDGIQKFQVQAWYESAMEEAEVHHRPVAKPDHECKADAVKDNMHACWGRSQCVPLPRGAQKGNTAGK